MKNEYKILECIFLMEEFKNMSSLVSNKFIFSKIIEYKDKDKMQ